MIQSTDSKKKNKYVSCIKINGVPILPPLVTPEKQKILLQYKQQAIKLEKHLKREHDLRTYIKQYYVPEPISDTNACSNHIVNTLEQQLSFGDLKTSKNVDNVPCTKQKSKASKLSCDLQVSQYINNEFALLKHSSSDCDTLRANSVVINLADYIVEDDAKFNKTSELNTSSSQENSPKSHLIRSNSFTIQTPSPILLEHLNKECSIQQITDDKTEVHDDILNGNDFLLETERSLCHSDGYMTCSKFCLIFDREERDEGKTLSNNEDVLNNKSVTTEYFTDHNESVVSFADLSELGPDSQGKNVSNVLESSNSDVNVLSNDFRFKEFISNNIPHSHIKTSPSEENTEKENVPCDKESDHNMNPSSNDKIANEGKVSSCVEADKELSLKLLLDNILHSHSKEILELLQTQQHEQELCLDKYQSIMQVLRNESVFALKYGETNSPHSQGSKTQSSSVREAMCGAENNSSTFESVNPSFITSDKIEKEHIAPTSTISAKEEWAATVIGARVKGYLTRRLLRTNRVQGLIQTINDSVIHAVQLHTASTEEINERDVEFHRRLIQQVSAGCYAFHDIFFSLSTQEKMSIIDLDRQKQKEKLLRGKNTRTSDKSKPQSARKYLNYK